MKVPNICGIQCTVKKKRNVEKSEGVEGDALTDGSNFPCDVKTAFYHPRQPAGSPFEAWVDV